MLLALATNAAESARTADAESATRSAVETDRMRFISMTLLVPAGKHDGSRSGTRGGPNPSGGPPCAAGQRRANPFSVRQPTASLLQQFAFCFAYTHGRLSALTLLLDGA